MGRPDISMGDADMAAFLRPPRTLQVATIGPRGWPHIAPMWYVVDEMGLVVFRSFTKSQKIVNLRRDPRLTVLVEEGVRYEDLRGVMIEGEAKLSSDPDEVLEVYVALAKRYPMADQDSASVRAAFVRYAAKNTKVTVEPRRVVSWDHRKLGGGY